MQFSILGDVFTNVQKSIIISFIKLLFWHLSVKSNPLTFFAFSPSFHAYFCQNFSVPNARSQKSSRSYWAKDRSWDLEGPNNFQCNIMSWQHITLIVALALVGGSRPEEGNIMVNGQPVCDDGTEAYRAATARVVCRFILISNDDVQLTILKFTNFLPIILLPCLFMKFLFLFVLIAYSLPQSQIFF